MSSIDVPALIAENTRLRDKLLEIVKTCAACDGTGCVTEGLQLRVVECPDCLDIRRVLE